MNQVQEQTTALTTLLDAALELFEFRGPPARFVERLLESCVALDGVACAALLRTSRHAEPEVIRVVPEPPPGRRTPPWLAAALRELGGGISERAFLSAAGRDVAIVPLPAQASTRGACALLLDPGAAEHREEPVRACELLLWATVVFESSRTAGSPDALADALRTLSAFNAEHHFRSAASTLCDNIASRWSCQRVSLGMLRGRDAKIVAMSHSEHVVRRTEIAKKIESAMEEAIDQDAEIDAPPIPGATYIARQAEDLRSSERVGAVLTLPLRVGREARGALTLEMEAENIPDEQARSSLRLVMELAAPRLLELQQRDRWFGARWAAGARALGAALVGPRHTWAKLLALAGAAFIAFALLADGTMRASGSFVIEAEGARIIAAPFSGVLESAPVSEGDRVVARETVLARLDTSELRLALAEQRARMAALATEAARLRAEDRIGEALATEARRQQAEARVQLLEHQIDQARITSPITGVVLEGDLRRLIGSVVQQGEPLFEVAPGGELRAVIQVPARRIADVEKGQQGTIATVAYPRRPIGFSVERIRPRARMSEQRSVFLVEARLSETPAWLSPGMEGVAKIETGRASYASIWTRGLRDWLRLHLWF